MVVRLIKYLAALFSLLLPTMVLGASFECSKVTSGSFESVICSSDELNKLDEELGDKYSATKAAIKAAKNLPYGETRESQSDLLTKTQRTWVSMVRSEPREVAIARLYRQRIRELMVLSQAYSASRFTLSCGYELCDKERIKQINRTAEAIYKKGDSNSRFYLPLLLHTLQCGERASSLDRCVSLIDSIMYSNSFSDADTILADIGILYPPRQYCHASDIQHTLKCINMESDFWKEKIREKSAKIKQTIKIVEACDAEGPYESPVRILKRLGDVDKLNRVYAEYADTYCSLVGDTEEGWPRLSGDECMFSLAEDHYRKLSEVFGENRYLDEISNYCQSHVLEHENEKPVTNSIM